MTVNNPESYKPNTTILGFINNFRNHTHDNIIHEQFANGYCYHFAHMLKSIFRDGEVCWVAPFSHFVLLIDNTPYDISGIYDGEGEYFIPEHYLGDAINDFKRIPGKTYNATQSDIDMIIDSYLNQESPTNSCIYCNTRGLIMYNGPRLKPLFPNNYCSNCDKKIIKDDDYD